MAVLPWALINHIDEMDGLTRLAQGLVCEPIVISHFSPNVGNDSRDKILFLDRKSPTWMNAIAFSRFANKCYLLIENVSNVSKWNILGY